MPENEWSIDEWLDLLVYIGRIAQQQSGKIKLSASSFPGLGQLFHDTFEVVDGLSVLLKKDPENPST